MKRGMLLCGLWMALMTATSSAQDWISSDTLYLPYVEANGQAGGDVETLQGTLFLPVWQTETDLLYADLRSTWSDQQTVEGNWGVGFRHMNHSGLIVGGYGFYDLRHTQSNNNFNQITLGLEMLTVDWDVRVNAYIPEDDTKAAAGATTATISNGTIVMNGGFEKAYYGSDFEFGWLLNDWKNGDVELRGYAGGYVFDRDAAGYDAIAGPRVRAELRVFDLDFLGDGSRVVAGAQYQYDELRGQQTSALLSLRIPLGRGRKLNRLQRRMVNPVVRDIDIVTNAQATGADEAVETVLAPRLIEGVTVIDGSTMDIQSMIDSAPDSRGHIYVFDNGQGDIVLSEGLQIDDGRFAGGVFQVRGVNSGRVVTFGNRANLVYDAMAVPDDIIEMGFESVVTGLRFEGGRNAIVASNQQGMFVVDNQIFNPAESGIRLYGNATGMVTDNIIEGAGENGLYIDHFFAGIVGNNLIAGSGVNGFKFDVFSGGELSGNEALDNDENGFAIYVMESGILVENTASGNGENGFEIEEVGFPPLLARDELFQGPELVLKDNVVVIADNIASNNAWDGFRMYSVGESLILDNVAQGNGDFGFYIDTLFGGEIAGNQALRNGESGFAIYETFSGYIVENSAISNGHNGFMFGRLVGGNPFFDERLILEINDEPFSEIIVAENIANNNGGSGLSIEYMEGGIIAANIANNNAYHGIEIFEAYGGEIVENSAMGNGENGFSFGGLLGGGLIGFDDPIILDGPMIDGPLFGPELTIVAANSASRNGGNGFAAEYMDSILFVDNFSSSNTLNGFLLDTVIESEVIANTAESSLGNGFQIHELVDSLFQDNISSNNRLNGFWFEDVSFSNVDGNLATSNTESGFEVVNAGGRYVDNVANDNGDHGYNIINDLSDEASNNTGSGNALNDTFINVP